MDDKVMQLIQELYKAVIRHKAEIAELQGRVAALEAAAAAPKSTGRKGRPKKAAASDVPQLEPTAQQPAPAQPTPAPAPEPAPAPTSAQPMPAPAPEPAPVTDETEEEEEVPVDPAILMAQAQALLKQGRALC